MATQGPVFEIRPGSADPAPWVAGRSSLFRKQSRGPEYHPVPDALQTPAGPALLTNRFAQVHQRKALQPTCPRPEITAFCFKECCEVQHGGFYVLNNFNVTFKQAILLQISRL